MEYHNSLAKIIVDSAFQVHKGLGPGLLETVYEAALEYELCKRGLIVDRQRPIPVKYKDVCFDEGYRADLLVNDKIVSVVNFQI